MYWIGVLYQLYVPYRHVETVSKICGPHVSDFRRVSQSRDKATISFVMSLCLSVRLEHLGSH
jgi:hypothetical protein